MKLNKFMGALVALFACVCFSTNAVSQVRVNTGVVNADVSGVSGSIKIGGAPILDVSLGVGTGGTPITAAGLFAQLETNLQGLNAQQQAILAQIAAATNPAVIAALSAALTANAVSIQNLTAQKATLLNAMKPTAQSGG